MNELISIIELILRAGELIEKEHETVEANLVEKQLRIMRTYVISVPLLARSLRRMISVSLNPDFDVESVIVNGHKMGNEDLEWEARRKNGFVKKSVYIPTSIMNAKTNDVVIEGKKSLDPIELRNITENIKITEINRPPDLTFISQSLGKDWNGACEISLLNKNKIRVCRFKYGVVVSLPKRELIEAPIVTCYVDLDLNQPNIVPRAPRIRDEGFNISSNLWFKEYYWEVNLDPGEKRDYIFCWRFAS